MDQQDPLQYIKDIQNLSWKDFGYDMQMTNPLGIKQGYMQGIDMASYFEDGGIQGGKIQNISANRITTSELVAAVSIGSTNQDTFLKLNGPKQRFEQYVDGVPQIILGNFAV